METLVVIALIAIMAAMSLPLARGPAPAQILSATASDIATRLRETRLAAIAENAPRVFLIDTATRTLGRDGAVRPIALAPGIDLDVTAAATGSASTARFVFHPDGSASGGRIILRPSRNNATPNTIGRSAVIDVDWLSGRISTRMEG
ncbi:MAG: hypothetical protein K2Y05_05055 [Hyphomicrobiaceae bacterium]|nr:hypothetical protein [Hyphomicrobiaceae bacterium]